MKKKWLYEYRKTGRAAKKLRVGGIRNRLLLVSSIIFGSLVITRIWNSSLPRLTGDITLTRLAGLGFAIGYRMSRVPAWGGSMVVGPFQQIPIGGGATADLYLLRYDDGGRLRSPRTEAQLKGSLGGMSDVFVLSHGWNNIPVTALERYRDFITGYIQQRQQYDIPVPAGYRPLLVGVIWPATDFVLPWEAGPEIAASPDPGGTEAARTEQMLSFVTESLDPDTDAALTELVDGRTAVDAGEARQAAAIVLAELWPDADPDGGATPPTVDELLAAWSAMDGAQAPGPVDPDDFGTVGQGAPAPEPAVAGGFSLDPRNLLRMATVWKMKARAGQVGVAGVGPLVRHILGGSGARLHLVGHSFGARVLLSALASSEPARPAHSMLLLQAAVNRWCFAEDVAGTGRPGGYNPVLHLVEKPIFTTFSAYDQPLTKVFQLAMRGSHLGEPDIAALGNTELYGALGGFGPAGLGRLGATMPAAIPGKEGYDLGGGREVIAIDGSREINGRPAITGHGDISNQTTWWALHCLTRAL
jgi:hypothetical protein